MIATERPAGRRHRRAARPRSPSGSRRRRSTRARLEADLRAAAARMDAGQRQRARPGDLPTDRVAALDDAFADAAGVPDRGRRGRAARPGCAPAGRPAGRSPRGSRGFKPDPLKRLHLDLGADGRQLTGRGPHLASRRPPRCSGPGSTPRSARSPTTSSPGPGPAVGRRVRRASVSRLPDLGDRLDRRAGRHRPRRRPDAGVGRRGPGPAVAADPRRARRRGAGSPRSRSWATSRCPSRSTPDVPAASRCRRCCCRRGGAGRRCSRLVCRCPGARDRAAQGARGRPAAARGDRARSPRSWSSSRSRPSWRPTPPCATGLAARAAGSPLVPVHRPRPRRRASTGPPADAAPRRRCRRRSLVRDHTRSRRGETPMNETLVTLQGWVGSDVTLREAGRRAGSPTSGWRCTPRRYQRKRRSGSTATPSGSPSTPGARLADNCEQSLRARRPGRRARPADAPDAWTNDGGHRGDLLRGRGDLVGHDLTGAPARSPGAAAPTRAEAGGDRSAPRRRRRAAGRAGSGASRRPERDAVPGARFGPRRPRPP